MTTETITAADAALGFTSQQEEVTVDSLPLRGELPEWLGGTLVRVTPALLEPGRHWFDGLAMLNAFGIGGGRVSYGSRFLESREYRHVREHGEMCGRGFGTDPCRSIFQRMSSLFDPGTTDNCNVNVTRLGERWIAMTETPIAIEFDPETLATIGPVEWTPNRSHASAHPQYDFERREVTSYVVRFGPRSSYQLYAIPDGSTERRTVAKVPVREPAYMHSFAMTSRYAVLFDQPLVVNPLRLAFGNRPFIENYEWKPERGSRFLIIDREAGKLRATVEADAFFTFHQVNAFEEDGHLVVDLVAFEDPSIIDALYLDKLRAGVREASAGRLRRYRLPLDGGRAEPELLYDEPIELPRIAYRSRNGRPYRFAYAAAQHGNDYFDSLVKIDVDAGSARRWGEAGCYPGEPVFVAAPGADVEDSGVVLSVVLDAPAERSFLLVLDAASFEELARAEAPQRIPFGFHGDFARREA
jgi:carotenoid cleavage dioxygenase-like enzyme